LYGKLAGDSTLTNQLGTPAPGRTHGIYYQIAPADAGFPYVIFQKQAGTPTYTFKAGHAAIDTEVWLIKGVATTPGDPSDQADTISSRLDALLTDGTVTISGATQMYLRRESDVDYSEVNEGQEYKHSGALFRLLYE